MSGTGTRCLQPNQTLTRAMVAQVRHTWRELRLVRNIHNLPMCGCGHLVCQCGQLGPLPTVVVSSYGDGT